MKERYLTSEIQSLCFPDHRIALIPGPRQCGKTTLAKMLLQSRKNGNYCNWDDPVFRRNWVKDPGAIVPQVAGKGTPMLVLDEIHKDRRWKRTLKGLYDTLTNPCDIVVTGSARLDVYKKGSDSLLGRYFSFRLHPFSLKEMSHAGEVVPDDLIERIFSRSRKAGKREEENLRLLMRFGPFPEPLLAQNPRRANLWRKTRREIVIREDLRDISRIPELGRIELMVSLLPERVGSMLSLNALREDLEVSHETVKRWMTCLKELYYLYEIKPYHRLIPRAIKKEGKVYFWDFSEVDEVASRFENLVANHLLKACHYWTDAGYGVFELHFLRNKEKQEIDFLIAWNKKPWLPIEVKLKDTSPSAHWKKFFRFLPCDRGIQLVATPHWKIHAGKEWKVLVAGAEEILNYFP